MNLSKLFFTTVLSVGAGFAAFADVYDTWYQFVPNQADGFNNAYWEDPQNPGTQVAPEADKDYYVPAGKILRTQATATFAGRTLAVSGTIRPITAGGNHTYNDLRLLDGSVYVYSTHATLSGNVWVEGSVAINPFLYGSNTYNYQASFSSSSDAVLTMAITGSAASAKTKNFDRESAYASPAYVYGDWSGFLGEVRIGAWTCFRLGPGSAMGYSWTCGGKVKAETNAFIDLVATVKNVTFNALDLQSGAELSLNNSGETLPVITVQNDLNLCAGSKISFKTKYSPAINTTKFTQFIVEGIPLFKLGDVAAMNLPTDMVFEGVTIENFTDFPMPGGLKLRVRENADGSKDVVLGCGTPAVTMLLNNSSNGSSQPLAFENDACWSSGKVPSKDESVEAVVVVSSMDLHAWQDSIFPKLRLTLPSGTTLYHQGNKFEVAELIAVAGSSMTTYSASSAPGLFGILTVYPTDGKYFYLGGWNGDCFKIYSEIRGAGDIKLFYSNPTSINAELFGTNTSYSGSIYVSSDLAKQWDPTAEPALDACATLYLNDGRNLGGACPPEKSWKSLMVDNHSKVQARNDVIVTEPTRGVYVSTAARFIVPDGKMMSFAGPTTFGGELTKLGAGCLALGKAQFSVGGAEPTEMPAEVANLVVAEGSVMANDVQSFDGVALNFAAGTALAVNAGATDADLLDTGALMTKAGSSLTIADAKLKVNLCGADKIVGSEKTVALLTVPAAVAQTLQLDVPNHIPGFAVSVAPRTNDDTSVTYVATLARRGLTIIFH